MASHILWLQINRAFSEDIRASQLGGRDYPLPLQRLARVWLVGCRPSDGFVRSSSMESLIDGGCTFTCTQWVVFLRSLPGVCRMLRVGVGVSGPCAIITTHPPLFLNAYLIEQKDSVEPVGDSLVSPQRRLKDCRVVARSRGVQTGTRVAGGCTALGWPILLHQVIPGV